ncbi:interleukin-17 receptor B [Rhinatrema bivittatum]|uniref:interleukin-17 receptor B n=1 Tax=Rhinatrema bivittatum TaxID=194408 RepID=UPI00112B0FED|nr:interleukin-17 receptor B [Rhinatrema bivittatum]
MPQFSIVRVLLVTVCWTQWGQNRQRGAETAATRTEVEQEQSINCMSHNAWQAPPEWLFRVNLTPSDLHHLNASLVNDSRMKSKTALLNVSWYISDNASLLKLRATMICIQMKRDVGQSICVRCNYTKPFQSERNSNGQLWEFHYLGFPVEPQTEYHIYAYNIPIANINEDPPGSSYNISIPGCNNSTMKYVDSCVATGSLWHPNITSYQIKGAMEVNYTVSSLADKYRIQLFNCVESFALLISCDIIGNIMIFKKNETRVSVQIPISGEISNFTVEITPFFPKCGNDCQRLYLRVVNCCQGTVLKPAEEQPPYLIILTSLLFISCVLTAAMCFIWKHGKVMRSSLIYSAELQPAMKVLVIYLKEKTFFQNTVLSFAEFLNDYCRADVILDMWQQERIAEMGPVQWFVTQKDIADKIIFLIAIRKTTKWVASVTETTVVHNDADNFMFNLALNLFCSDLKSQSSLHKYMVVYFDELNQKGDLSLNVLNTCSQYCFMKDINLFCKDLLNLPQTWRNSCNMKLVTSRKTNLKCIQKLQTAVLEQKNQAKSSVAL